MFFKVIVLCFILFFAALFLAPDFFALNPSIKQERQLLLQLSIQNSSCCHQEIVFPPNSNTVFLRRACHLLPSHLLCLSKCFQASSPHSFATLSTQIKDRSLFLDRFCPLIGISQINSTELLPHLQPKLSIPSSFVSNLLKLAPAANKTQPLLQIDSIDHESHPAAVFAQLEQIFHIITQRLQNSLHLNSSTRTTSFSNEEVRSKKSLPHSMPDVSENEIDDFDLMYENKKASSQPTTPSSLTNTEMSYTCMSVSVNQSHLARLHSDPNLLFMQISNDMKLEPISSSLQQSSQTVSTSSSSLSTSTQSTFLSSSESDEDELDKLFGPSEVDAGRQFSVDSTGEIEILDDPAVSEEPFDGRQMSRFDFSCEPSQVVLVISTLLTDNIQLRQLLSQNALETKTSILNGMITTTPLHLSSNSSIASFVDSQIQFHKRLFELCRLLQDHEDTLVGIMDRCGDLMQFSNNLRLMIQESLQQLLNSRAGCQKSHSNRLLSNTRSLQLILNHSTEQLRAHPTIVQQLFTCVDWRRLDACEQQRNRSDVHSTHRIDQMAQVLILRTCYENSVLDSVAENELCKGMQSTDLIIRFAQLIANEKYSDALKHTFGTSHSLVGASLSFESDSSLFARSVLQHTIERIEEDRCRDDSHDLLRYCAIDYAHNSLSEIGKINRTIDLNQLPIESSFESSDRFRRAIKRMCCLRDQWIRCSVSIVNLKCSTRQANSLHLPDASYCHQPELKVLTCDEVSNATSNRFTLSFAYLCLLLLCIWKFF